LTAHEVGTPNSVSRGLLVADEKPQIGSEKMTFKQKKKKKKKEKTKKKKKKKPLSKTRFGDPLRVFQTFKD